MEFSMLSLTATDLNRFAKCNGSRLLGKVTRINQDTTVKDEGNAAHWLCEEDFKGNFKADDMIDKKAPNGIFITVGMIKDCEKYLADIVGKGDTELVTSHTDNQHYEIRGRADHVCFEENTLFISDFKYGWKVVEPENNWTLISHALGWYDSVKGITPEKIVFRIYQPRGFHPQGALRTWEISHSELKDKFDELKTMLINPSDKVVTSEQCYKCSSMTQCPGNQIALTNSIDVAEIAYDSEVDNDQLSLIMDEIKRAKSVLNEAEVAYDDLAATRIRHGKIVPNYSLHTALGNNTWKKGMSVEVVTSLTNVDVSKKAIITPNQAKKAGVSQEVIDAFCERPNKGIKLVRVDGSKKAEQLFGKNN